MVKFDLDVCARGNRYAYCDFGQTFSVPETGSDRAGGRGSLTTRQMIVLRLIALSVRDRGYPPTLREIGARMGIRSTNGGVNDHLRALERKGCITKSDITARGLTITQTGREVLERRGIDL